MQPDPSALAAQEYFARHAEPRRPRLVGTIQELAGLVHRDEFDLQVALVPDSDPAAVSADGTVRDYAKAADCFVDFAARHRGRSSRPAFVK
jgi:hypothetical protein